MQDEPGERVHFQHKMSLKEDLGKLKVEDQRAAGREVEPGPDSCIFGSQRGGSV
jgi:hypothetical protein